MKTSDLTFKGLCEDFDFKRMLKYRQDIIKDYTEDGLSVYELSAKYTMHLKYIRKAVIGRMRGVPDASTLSVK